MPPPAGPWRRTLGAAAARCERGRGDGRRGTGTQAEQGARPPRPWRGRPGASAPPGRLHRHGRPAGAPVGLRGEAFLLVTFDGARASEPGGGATFQLAKPRPGYRSIKHVQPVEDAGGRVRFGIGLGAVAGYKVSELPPDRMYVDVAA
jgi:hypothetical protein